MAVWRMQRRLLSLITTNITRQPNNFSFRTDSSPNVLPTVNSFLHGEQFFKRQTRTFSEALILNSIENSVTTDQPAVINDSEVTFTAKSELKVSPRHDMAMMFICKVCETRSVKTISRESYEKGVVVALCGGCNNYHLIADHLGIFGEKGSIKDILAARGEEVRKGNSDTLNLTLEDLIGSIKYNIGPSLVGLHDYFGETHVGPPIGPVGVAKESWAFGRGKQESQKLRTCQG